jgi:hypothetical protein
MGLGMVAGVAPLGAGAALGAAVVGITPVGAAAAAAAAVESGFRRLLLHRRHAVAAVVASAGAAVGMAAGVAAVGAVVGNLRIKSWLPRSAMG